MQPKILLFVQKYYHPSQSFVNRHAQHIFGGHCAIMAERHYKDPPQDAIKPNFIISDHVFNAHDLLRLPYYALYNQKTHHSLRIPYGNHFAAMREFIAHQKIDVILAEFGSQAIIAQAVGEACNLPVFSYFRGRDASYWLQNAQRVQAYQKVFPKLAGIFAVSQFLLDNLKSVGLEHHNAHVVPSGTDIDHFQPQPKTPHHYVSVGRFVEKKNPLLTIQAFYDASKNTADAQLDMIGSGPLFKDAQALVESLNAQHKVILHGAQNSEFIAGKLAQADGFILHCQTAPNGEAEGFPSAIQEAMACGCAILSTRHAGNPEFVADNETGWLSEEGDITEFTQNIQKSLHAGDHLHRMQNNARALAVEKLDYRKLYQKVENTLKDTIHSNQLTK